MQLFPDVDEHRGVDKHAKEEIEEATGNLGGCRTPKVIQANATDATEEGNTC